MSRSHRLQRCFQAINARMQPVFQVWLLRTLVAVLEMVLPLVLALQLQLQLPRLVVRRQTLLEWGLLSSHSLLALPRFWCDS
jgi:hypothetical protein